jgi:hypothetical protein
MSLPILMASPLSKVCALWLLIAVHAALYAQLQPTVIATGLSRIEGVDPDNQVAYVRLFLTGALVPPAETDPPPTLTAQCTRQPSGKLGFELFANFGGVDDLAYHRPWMPKDGGIFPPPTQKIPVTMEFLGYTRVKPVKRQWERVAVPSGQLRYNTPSVSSSNMEDITFYMQYLKALPTLRLTYSGKTVEFLVTPLFDQIRKEPVCRASRL